MTVTPHMPAQPWLNAIGSKYFLEWLWQQRCSLAFTTYQTGKLFLVGCKSAHRSAVPIDAADLALSVFERTYNHCMGMWATPDGRTIWLSSRYQIWRLERTPAEAVPDRPAPTTATANDANDRSDQEPRSPQWAARGFDFAYVPRVSYTTGHLDVHDLAVDSAGRPIFVNTMFGCLATVSERASFKPLWRPPFLSALVPEDRCHLNGLAMRDGRPAYVTVVSRTDVADGWRDKRRDGGCVLDIATGEAVCTGLSMPHSPRWYRDRLWVLNSGTGELGWVDLASGRFEAVAFCPGYLRGLKFQGEYAIATLSKPRHASFQGLELDDRLGRQGADPQCGLQIIHLPSGAITDWLRLDGTLVTELYDAVTLPGVRQPLAVGFKTTEIERLLLVDDDDSEVGGI